jgi:acetyl esterase/lipase
MMFDRRGLLISAGAVTLAAGACASPVRAQGLKSNAFDPVTYLDPELRAAARELLGSGGPALSEKTLPALRTQNAANAEPLLDNVPVLARQVRGAGTNPDVTVYIVNARSGGARPGILHTHGGGHVLGSAKSELRYLQQLARELDCIVLTVEYRLAPAVRYTGSVEDNYAALKWMYGAAGELGLDSSRIALLGESAGGTHAALLAVAARDRGEVPVIFQCLVYPMLDDRTGTASRLPPWIGAVLWTREANRFGWRAFTGSEPGTPGVPVAAVPARIENLNGLPPAWIGVGGADLFVAEDIAYAERLTEAAVPTELLVVPRAFHAFDRIVPAASVSRRFTRAKMDALRRAFALVGHA